MSPCQARKLGLPSPTSQSLAKGHLAGDELPGTSAAPEAEGSLQRARKEGKTHGGQGVLGNGKGVPGDLLHSITVFWVEWK